MSLCLHGRFCYIRAMRVLFFTTWFFASFWGAAAPIPGLFSTGVNEQGQALSGGALDPHWTVTLSADPLAQGPQAFHITTRYVDWVQNTPRSAWIAHTNQPSNTTPQGLYRFTTFFDLTGYDETTAVIVSRFTSDDSLLSVRLNDEEVWPVGTTTNYRQWTYFTFSTGFRPGVNRLDFLVNNGLAQVGLIFEVLEGTRVCPSATSPPFIDRHPSSLKVRVGQPAQFQVLSECGSQTYQWRHNGKPLEGQTQATLLLDVVEGRHEGIYDVQVSNANGTTTSQSATLTVENPAAELSLEWAEVPRLRLRGLPEISYEIHVADDPSGSWSPWTVVTLSAEGEAWLDDPEGAPGISRFYRAVSMP
jgi:hypothetical protein